MNILENIRLSKNGLELYNFAINKCKEEIKKFGRIRTTFFYKPSKNDNPDYIELRDIINNWIKEYNISFPFDNRQSDYFFMVNTKAFDIFSIQIHRLSPDNYIISTQNDLNKIIFIIRDSKIYKLNNIKIVFDDYELFNGTIEEVDFHLSKEQLL